MHPIQSPHFAQLIRIWGFLNDDSTNLINLSAQWSNLKLQQLQNHIEANHITSTLIQQLLVKFVKSQYLHVKLNHKKKDQLALMNDLKEQFIPIFKDLNIYNIAIIEVNKLLKPQNTLLHFSTYHQLTIHDRYLLISSLVQIVTSYYNQQKNKLKNDQNQQQCHNQTTPKKQNQLQQKEQIEKIKIKIKELKFCENKLLLGIVNSEIYLFLKTLQHSIYKYNIQQQKWYEIKGKQNIEILIQNILNSDKIQDEQILLIENLHQIKQFIQQQQQQQQQYLNFRINNIKQIKQYTLENNNINRIISELLLKIQEDFSNYIAWCYNSRYTNKQCRKQWRQLVIQAKDFYIILELLFNFVASTNSSFDVLENGRYDCSLFTDQPQQSQFFKKKFRIFYINKISQNSDLELQDLLQIIRQQSQNQRNNLQNMNVLYFMFFTLTIIEKTRHKVGQFKMKIKKQQPSKPSKPIIKKNFNTRNQNNKIQYYDPQEQSEEISVSYTLRKLPQRNLQKKRKLRFSESSQESSKSLGSFNSSQYRFHH